MVKGVVFDVDGTILDSMGIWDVLPYRYLELKGKEAKPDLREVIFTMTLEQSAQYFQKEYGITDSQEQIQSDILKIIEEYYRNEVLCKEGIHSLLNQIDVPMIVVTIGDENLVSSAFQRLHIDSYFSKIITCAMYNVDKSKPDIFKIASDILKVDCSDILVFEDSLVAIKSAKQAGCQVVGIYDFYSQKDQEEIQEMADYYIKDYKSVSWKELIG